MMQPPRISVIIPAFNEEKYLPRLLDSIETARIARDRGARVVRVEKRAIAAARNGGARAASGGLLAFVDADTLSINPRTFDVIEDLMSSGRYVAGATGIHLERWSAGIAVTYALMMPMVWLTGMDTGVVFCRREDFVAVGGYDESRLVAEDVMLLLALRRLGRRRGQRLVRARSVKAVGCTRKFDEHGDWHYLTMMPRVAFNLLLGKAGARETVLRYWYNPRR